MITTPRGRDRTEDRREHGDSSRAFQVKMRTKNTLKRLLTSAPPAPRPSGRYLVVPVLGQSNAQGNGFPLDPEGLDAPDPMVHQWAAYGRRRRRIVLATEPLMHQIPGKGVGFALTFAKHLAADTGRPVLLVPCARGDSGFHPKNGFTWNPADTSTRTNLFENAVTQIDRACSAVAECRKNPTGEVAEVAAFLWHQGETDAPLLDADEYRNQFDDLILRLRDRYGVRPFVMSRMAPEQVQAGHPDHVNIDAVHRDTPRRHPGIVLVDPPVGMTNDHDLHFSAAGQRDLGARMYEGFAALARR